MERHLSVPSSRYFRLRKHVHDIVEPGAAGGESYDVFMMWLISLNVVALVLETVVPLHTRFEHLFLGFEVVSVVVFSVDYVLRLWSSTVVPRYAHPVAGRLRFAVTPLALIDLLAVLPSLLPLFGLDLRFVRAARFARVLRLGKLTRYSSSMRMVARVIAGKKEELMTTLLLTCVVLLAASSLMYFAERGAQPDKFASIPAAMWWGVATLTTVGYGDVFPVTVVGKLLSAVIAVAGIGVVALPTSILGAAFVEEMQRQKESVRPCCRHCGNEVD